MIFEMERDDIGVWDRCLPLPQVMWLLNKSSFLLVVVQLQFLMTQLGQHGSWPVLEGSGWGRSCLCQPNSGGVGLWGFSSSSWEIFSGNFPAFCLKALANWNAWLIKRSGFWGRRWTPSQTSLYTRGPLSLPLRLCDTRVLYYLGLVKAICNTSWQAIPAAWVLYQLGFKTFASI